MQCNVNEEFNCNIALSSGQSVSLLPTVSFVDNPRLSFVDNPRPDAGQARADKRQQQRTLEDKCYPW